LGGLWALEWAWHIGETNSGICMPNLISLAFIVSEISAFFRTDRQTDMARSTPLLILTKNKYTLWGRKRFLLPVAYFPTNRVYPFTLRVTGINTKNHIPNSKKKIEGIICFILFSHQFSDRSYRSYMI